ncbi:hypothetical protein [Thiomicrorhabdus sp.]|uniref:hypothetical protein n=1 Tax=Thiomicrorhabdus sp. TaxID=2039724 RepID=UPI0029C6B1F8|nr:hypothetical protein [Thiomicrorhabdus sp.]
MQNLSHVINYDLPYPDEENIHHTGRTGRAENFGEAISQASKDNFKNLCMIESLLNQLLECREVAEFPVRKPVPISILNYHRK